MTASTVDQIRLLQNCILKITSFQPKFGESSQAHKKLL